jgi:hypothetical protein
MYSKGLTLAVVALGALAVFTPGALAQGALDDETERQEAREIEKDLQTPGVTPVQWGVGLRLRYVMIPKFLLEQFWEEVATGPANPGFGLDVIRKRGDFEFSFGFEYESLSGDEGFWLEKGDDGVSNGQTPDLVEFDGFSWITLDASFVFHKPLHELFALRYGGGFGLGILLGEVLQTDAVCTSRNINDPGVCMRDPAAQQINDPADIPPVFPVINLLFGGQLRPVEKLAINFEVGLRTAFYTGFGASYMF